MLSAIVAILIITVWPAYSNQPINQWKSADKTLLAAPLRDYSLLSAGLELTADSAAVVDAKTGKFLYKKNITTILPIASITKLMTALVFLDLNPGWSNIVTLQPIDEVYKAKYVYRGEQITVRDLFYLSLVGSDNNATQALVRSTGLTNQEFLLKLQARATSLGLVDTQFADVTGLSADNVSTAADLVILATQAWQQPEILAASSANEYQLEIKGSGLRRRVVNTNKLLNGFLNVEAGKTGYTDEAGYCLIAKINDNGNSIITVVLGSQDEDNRFQDAKALAWWVFNNYRWP